MILDRFRLDDQVAVVTGAGHHGDLVVQPEAVQDHVVPQSVTGR